MKSIQDDELERALGQHSLKGPREGLRERVLTNSRAAWNRSVTKQSAGRFKTSWAFSGWLAIAATVLFLLNLGVDSFNRNTFHALFIAYPPMETVSQVAAVKAFASELRQQNQMIQNSTLIN